MNTSSTTTTTTESVADKQAAFRDSLVEPEYAAIRQQLGLRPHLYATDGADIHPDRRPCPSWCWVGNSGGKYGHEVEWDHPVGALHSFDGIAHIVASLYEGAVARGSEPRWVEAASVELDLEQRGQEAPIIRASGSGRRTTS